MAAPLTPANIQTLPSMDPCHHPGSIICLLFHSPTAPRLSPKCDMAWHLLPSSPLLLSQPVAFTASPQPAASGSECPGGILPCPNPFSPATGDRLQQMEGALPAAGSSGASSRSCGGKLGSCWQSRGWAALLELPEQMPFPACHHLCGLLLLLTPRFPRCINYAMSLRIIFPTPAWGFRNLFQCIWR